MLYTLSKTPNINMIQLKVLILSRLSAFWMWASVDDMVGMLIVAFVAANVVEFSYFLSIRFSVS